MTQPQFQIDVDVRGLQEAIAASRKLQTGFVGAVVNDGLRSIGRTFVPGKGIGPLADATPKDTGKLARSTFFEIAAPKLGGLGIRSQELLIKQPARTAKEYGAQAYGAFVRGGTRPHEIRARLKKTLHFFVGNEEFFPTKVNHPGTEPNPYHIRVAQALQIRVQSIVNRMTSRITSQYRRG